MYKRLFVFVLIFSLSIGLSFASNLEVTVINVGQGDSIFIKAPNGLKILIDAGGGSFGTDANAFDNISAVLTNGGVSSASPLDYIILTHFHNDHYDYIDNVIERFGLPKIGVMDRGGDKKYSGTSIANIPQEYLNAVNPKRNPGGVLSPGARIELGNGAYLWLLAIGNSDNGAAVKSVKVLDTPDVNIGSDIENGKSLVFLLKWNGFDMLLGGDCNEDIEHYLGKVIRSKGINIDVFKCHHHGSATSNSGEFLNDILPEVTICSVGDSLSYKHPRREAYDRIYSYKSFIYQTNRGNDSSLSYPEPPLGYGVLASGNIKVLYNGYGDYSVQTPKGTDNYKTDE